MCFSVIQLFSSNVRPPKVCFVFTFSLYTGLFGRKVHVGYHGNGLDCGDQQGVVVGGRRGDGGGEAADLGDPLLHAASRQASLSIVVPALLHRLADLSQTLRQTGTKHGKMSPHLLPSKLLTLTLESSRRLFLEYLINFSVQRF